jgi:D-proline reductase (dithiol) PrdD
MSNEISKLVIKSFNIHEVKLTEKTSIVNGSLHIRENIQKEAILGRDEFIKALSLKIIEPNEKNIFINSILDFSPIATKVIGNIGEGVTHTLNGVCVMLTGVDEIGNQIAEFGSSEGILKEQVIFDRAGTPRNDDIIIHIDVTLKEFKGTERKAIIEIHRACDYIVQEIRESLKKLSGRYCDEKHEYNHTFEKYRKSIVIIKQVAGQGAMYDTSILPNEPGGVEGSRSIIDLGNMPIVLTPNEYRDGALRAMH